MTDRRRAAGSAGARWLVSALALAGSLVLWIMLARQATEAPAAAATDVVAPADPIEPVDIVDVTTSASGRRLR